MKTKVLILLFSFYAFNSTAQVNSFSLNEAVDYALKNNPSSVNASNDLKIAKAKKWETIATELPQISAFIDYNNNIKQKVSLVPAEFFGGNPGEFAEISFGTKQTFEGTATLKQLLFNGSYSVALSSIKLYLEIAPNAKIKTDLEVKRNVISAYGNVLVSQERVKLLNQNLENITVNLNEVQKIYENGLTELTRDLRSSNLLDYNPEYITYPVNLLSDTFDKIFSSDTWQIVANFSAHKHVRSEKDKISVEALIKNNVYGAIKLLNLCQLNPPKHFFSVSTDKAANPVNIMGASKSLMEKLILSKKNNFRVSTARFANVAFSNGSLLDGFIYRLNKKQPLSCPSDIKRFFVTLCFDFLSCIFGACRGFCFAFFVREVCLSSFRPKTKTASSIHSARFSSLRLSR